MADVEISFVESLLGFSYPLQLLSGKTLDVGRSGITLGGMSEVFHGSGMPHAERGFTDLVVLYTVAMPTQLTPQQREVLDQVLSPSSGARNVVEQQMNSAAAEAAASAQVWWDSTAGSIEEEINARLRSAASSLEAVRQQALWDTAEDELSELPDHQAITLWLWRVCFQRYCSTGSATAGTEQGEDSQAYGQSLHWGDNGNVFQADCIKRFGRQQYRMAALCPPLP